MEIQQSPLYARCLQSLGWQTPKVDGFYVFIKKFPLIGGFAKIQRVQKLPNVKKLVSILKRDGVRRIVVEPDASINQTQFSRWCADMSKRVKILTSPYLATKTRIIDLQPSEEDIFQGFSEGKRRAVRRATTHGVVISESRDIDSFLMLKNRSAGFLGFITTTGIKPLWNIFAPPHATILLAYSQTNSSRPVGGVLLLFWDKIAYYWLAAATRQGKKLFAPTLLVWETLKLAKKKGCTQFDFVGVWDERIPKMNHNWRGFTKFKEGFGGKPRYYPIVKMPETMALALALE